MIRPATVEDVGLMTEHGEDFYYEAELGKCGLEWCGASFVDFCKVLIKISNGTILVAEEKGEIIGGVAGMIAPWFFNQNQLVLQELWWWVGKEHRGGTTAVRLMKTLLKWGEIQGAKVAVLAHMDIENGDRLEKIYTKMGFSLIEAHYAKEI